MSIFHYAACQLTNTFHSASSSLPVQRSLRKYPKPPPPDADSREVQIFFKEVFLANRPNPDEAQTTALALKLQVNGDGLYRLSKETFVKAFGADGEVIYDLVQHGKWGHEGNYWYYLKFITICLYIVAAGFGGGQILKEQKDRSFIIPIVAVAIAIPIILLHRVCASESVIGSKIWPERLKIRNRTAWASAKWAPL